MIMIVFVGEGGNSNYQRIRDGRIAPPRPTLL